jgi:hypothetical protein
MTADAGEQCRRRGKQMLALMDDAGRNRQQ